MKKMEKENTRPRNGKLERNEKKNKDYSNKLNSKNMIVRGGGGAMYGMEKMLKKRERESYSEKVSPR